MPWTVFLLLISSLLLSAEHGSTKAWLLEMNQLSKKLNALVPNQKIDFRWSPDGSTLSYNHQDADRKESLRQVNLTNGTISDLKTPVDDHQTSVAPRLLLSQGAQPSKMGRKSSDKNWTVRIRDKQLQLKGKNGDFQKIDFSLPEGSAWTGQVCWHRDSSCFAAFHKSNHPIREVHLVQSSPEEQLQPLHETYP